MSVRRSRTPPPTKEHPSLASGWLERKSGLLDKWSRVRAAIERPKAGQTAYRLSIAEANGWDTNSSDCYILCPGVVIQEITNIGQQAIEILSARRCLEDGSDERLEKPLVLRVPEDSAISFRGWQHALQECITDSPPPRPRRLNLEVPARLTAASSSGTNSTEDGRGYAGFGDDTAMPMPTGHKRRQRTTTKVATEFMKEYRDEKALEQQHNKEHALETAELEAQIATLSCVQKTQIETLFESLDQDGSGALDKQEIKQLTKHLGERFSTREISMEYEKMVSRQYRKLKKKLEVANLMDDHVLMQQLVADERMNKYNEIDVITFTGWWSHFQQARRRTARKIALKMFNEAATRRNQRLGLLPINPLTLERNDLAEMITNAQFRTLRRDYKRQFEWYFKSVELTSGVEEPTFGNNLSRLISRSDFEDWCTIVLQDEDVVSIPVVPEYMALKIESLTKRSNTASIDAEAKGSRWNPLSRKLRALVSLQKRWGNLHYLYTNLGFDTVEAPPGSYIRLPDSNFSVRWDCVQVLALMYVAYVVPLRTGFFIDEDPFSVAWWFDVLVDIYFFADLILGFRTAFYHPNGVLESDTKVIARRYIQSWFTVDVLSCLPIQYITLAFADTDEASTSGFGSKTKSFKLVRLVRLTKLLRLAKIKRLLMQYDSLMGFQPIIGVSISFFIIFFAAHLLACTWNLLGHADSTLPDGTVVYAWASNYDTHLNWGSSFQPSLGFRYVVSMYSIFTGAWAFTGNEYSFSMVSQLVIAFIHAGLAGLMSTLMATLSQGEEEYNFKLLSIKAWMKARKLDQRDKDKVMAAFNNKYRDKAIYEQELILSEMPVPLASDITYTLYGKYISSLPMFRKLGKELHTHLCRAVTHEVCMKNQIIFEEGSVGTELYFIMKGEVEIESNGVQLGFLGENSFFGELPFLESQTPAASKLTAGNQHETRMRTVRTTFETELGILGFDELETCVKLFPELAARLFSFVAAKQPPNKSRKIGKLSEQERYPVEPDSARSSASSFVTFDDDARMQTRALREELHEVRGMCQQILAQRSAE